MLWQMMLKNAHKCGEVMADAPPSTWGWSFAIALVFMVVGEILRPRRKK